METTVNQNCHLYKFKINFFTTGNQKYYILTKYYTVYFYFYINKFPHHTHLFHTEVNPMHDLIFFHGKNSGDRLTFQCTMWQFFYTCFQFKSSSGRA